MKKSLTKSVILVLAFMYCPTILKAQTCVTCPGNTVTGSSASALGINNTVSGTFSQVLYLRWVVVSCNQTVAIWA